jgi:hypothetical protein
MQREDPTESDLQGKIALARARAEVCLAHLEFVLAAGPSSQDLGGSPEVFGQVLERFRTIIPSLQGLPAATSLNPEQFEEIPLVPLPVRLPTDEAQRERFRATFSAMMAFLSASWAEIVEYVKDLPPVYPHF